MKVAVIIERYDITLGGAEWLVFELVSALSQLGLDVEIIAAKANDTAINTRILCRNYHSKRISLAHFTKTVHQYLSRNHFDLVHSVIPIAFADVYQPPGGSFAEATIRNAASYQNRSVTLYKKATAFINRRRTEALCAEKELCKNPNGPIVAALSEYVKEQFKVHYGLEDKRIVVIPNGVSIDRQVDSTNAQKLRSHIFHSLGIEKATNPVFFLFVANNFRLKGLQVLIRALALLSKSGMPNLPYLIVAGNDKPHKYHRLAKKLGIEKRIVFLGFLRDIQNALAISDVAVLPTFYDPCSRYILEAIAAEKPVITTKFNGAADLFVNNRHGKVIDRPENIHALAQAISFFTDKTNTQKASQAIVEDNLKEKISITRVAKQLESVYESILKKT
jgi:UDP-glucose:(heptosyl)LPS alpha-1,3-glucosyltransferase